MPLTPSTFNAGEYRFKRDGTESPDITAQFPEINMYAEDEIADGFRQWAEDAKGPLGLTAYPLNDSYVAVVYVDRRDGVNRIGLFIPQGWATVPGPAYS